MPLPELRVEDALLYLDQVKMEFGDRPQIYHEFLDVMKTFRSQQIDTPGVIRRVSALFQGNKDLLLGFNVYLPEGYKIELPGEGASSQSPPPPGVAAAPAAGVAGRPSAVAAMVVQSQAQSTPSAAGAPRAPGVPAQPLRGGPPRDPSGLDSAPLPLPGPSGPQQADAAEAVELLPSLQQRVTTSGPPGLPPMGGGSPPIGGPPYGMPPIRGSPGGAPPPPGNSAHEQPSLPGPLVPAQGGLPGPQGQEAVRQQPPPRAPVEFNHAVNYATTVKKRFAAEPETYNKFREILHTYQKNKRRIKETLGEVCLLFANHPDLVRGFACFLPGAVQAQGKAQLERVAKFSEKQMVLKRRKRNRTSEDGNDERTCPICFEEKDDIVPIPHWEAKGDVSSHCMCRECTQKYTKNECPFCSEVFRFNLRPSKRLRII